MVYRIEHLLPLAVWSQDFIKCNFKSFNDKIYSTASSSSVCSTTLSVSDSSDFI